LEYLRRSAAAARPGNILGMAVWLNRLATLCGGKRMKRTKPVKLKKRLARQTYRFENFLMPV